MSCQVLMGYVIGGIIVTAIQLTIGNPFIWLYEKYRERKYLKEQKKAYEDYIKKGFSEETASYITGYRS